MNLFLSILVYVTFGLVILFGLLAYTKDATQYPQFPRYFRYSVILLALLISIQIFIAFPNLMGFFLWLFFVGIVFTIQMILKMIGAKDLELQKKYRKWAVIISLITIVVLIILTIVTVQTVQNL